MLCVERVILRYPARREADALIHERVSQCHAARAGFDKQQAELCGIRPIRIPDQKDVAHTLGIDAGNPPGFALCIEVGHESATMRATRASKV
jgi:hypothetical protein